MKESDPVGWATETSRTSPSAGDAAREMESRASSEYEGSEWLEQAAKEGLI